MTKKLNIKLVNILLITLIIYVVLISSSYWGGFLLKIYNTLLPFFLAFVLAYILDPFVKKLESYNIRRSIALTAVILLFILLLVALFWLTLPSIYNQLVDFTKACTKGLTDIQGKFSNVDLGEYKDTLTNTLNDLIKSLGKYVSNGSIDLIGKCVKFVTNGLIVLFVGTYILVDMDKIRSFLKKLLKNNKKTYNYLKALDKEMGKYLNGMFIFLLIQLIEYTLLFKLIGHTSWLLLGILACVTSVIPYFGGMFTGILALLTASVISTKVFVLTILMALIFPNIDGYIISPHIFGKTNNINPILVILIAAICSKIFGIFGIMLGLPLYLVLRTTYYYFEDDIKMLLSDKSKEKE